MITAGRIRGALSAPFDIGGQRRHVRVSLGCRVAGAEEDNADVLMRDADTAMYQAKEAGKDRVEVFSDETPARLLRRLELEQRLRTALERSELEVHFQPQIDLSTGRLAGAEALVRWADASPAEFIPLAGGDRADRPARHAGPAPRDRRRSPSCSARPQAAHDHRQRLHAAALEDPDFPAIVEAAIVDAGIDASDLLPGDHRVRPDGGQGRRPRPAARVQGARRLRRHRRLRRRPLEPRAPAPPAGRGAQGRPARSSAASAPRPRTPPSSRRSSASPALGLHVVAEGVETPLQADQLIALGCAVAQGFPVVARRPAGAAARRRRSRPRSTRRSATTAASAPWSTR